MAERFFSSRGNLAQDLSKFICHPFLEAKPGSSLARRTCSLLSSLRSSAAFEDQEKAGFFMFPTSDLIEPIRKFASALQLQTKNCVDRIQEDSKKLDSMTSHEDQL